MARRTGLNEKEVRLLMALFDGEVEAKGNQELFAIIRVHLIDENPRPLTAREIAHGQAIAARLAERSGS